MNLLIFANQPAPMLKWFVKEWRRYKNRQKVFIPGIGYGGSCFPKDVNALIKTADDFNSPMKILKVVDEANKIKNWLS
jgi:UDP-N-acetyl-D-mannosaminuronate dehydrogenase